MDKKAIILGGGVAGMSAAHELIERGFGVEVYEMKAIPGGKARSVSVPDTGVSGRRDLPGEHGFRFFPRFYQHVTDTMKRIPYPGNHHGVFDNLVGTSRIELARYDMPPIEMSSRFPRSLRDLKVILSDVLDTSLGISESDKDFFAEKIWQIMTSCEDRRLNEYEKIGWWQFIDADARSQDYQDFFGYGLTRSLVAAKANLASTKTVGDIFIQLLFDVLEPGCSSDRVLNGPTNEVWVDPWLNYLQEQGVIYHLGAKVNTINCEAGMITSATITEQDSTYEVTGDYYIAAFPIEVMAQHITPNMLAADPSLANLQTLSSNVSWMNGAQFYLKGDVPITNGHAIYLNSAWAITSVSQHQFWPHLNFNQYGDGTVNGLLSVDISEWNQPGLNGKMASECSHEEIRDEVWSELKRSLNYGGNEVLADDNLHSWFLDPDIVSIEQDATTGAIKITNTEPLLVNLINTWHLRPTTFTRIPNLFLASDYIQTYTDLATMEGANEAARRAVNCIIDAAGSHASHCDLWKLHEPFLLEPLRAMDGLRYKRGLPWSANPL